MTRGRCGSLHHFRMTFSFTTPRRFNRRTRRNLMKFLGLRAFITLIFFEFYLARKNFGALYNKVRNFPLEKVRGASPDAVERICLAVDAACIWYPKQVLCLQRSAATTCLLRRHGIHAKMVIAAKQMPLHAHAWVEVDARAV